MSASLLSPVTPGTLRKVSQDPAVKHPIVAATGSTKASKYFLILLGKHLVVNTLDHVIMCPGRALIQKSY